MPKAQIAFVCGVGRSGTSTLADLLNGHPRICIGMERYKYILLVRGRMPLSDELFSKERFFDFRPEETNIAATNYSGYQGMPAKWDRARIVGDKVPHLFVAIPYVLASFPSAKIIYIVRNIEDVAASWAAREERPGDKWKGGFVDAIHMWNKANRIILKQKRRAPGSILVVSYERLFGGSLFELLRLCKFLRVWPSSGLLLTYRRKVRYYQRKIKSRPRGIRPGWAKQIAELADRNVQNRILRLW